MAPVLLAKLVKLALCQRRKAACMEQAAFFLKKILDFVKFFLLQSYNKNGALRCAL